MRAAGELALRPKIDPNLIKKIGESVIEMPISDSPLEKGMWDEHNAIAEQWRKRVNPEEEK